jgi:hypothetical protein
MDIHPPVSGFFARRAGKRGRKTCQKARKSLMALGQPVVIPLVKVMKKFNLAQCRWVAAKVFDDIVRIPHG